jgi:hypothetical protein
MRNQTWWRTSAVSAGLVSTLALFVLCLQNGYADAETYARTRHVLTSTAAWFVYLIELP